MSSCIIALLMKEERQDNAKRRRVGEDDSEGVAKTALTRLTSRVQAICFGDKVHHWRRISIRRSRDDTYLSRRTRVLGRTGV